ncbi:MAG: hypothetical protein JW788_00065, partial [Candidatus Omnitrophica bacterium]|nr:hypothetical protein [Candidatus Omnitrophota bacterium]
MHKLKLKVLSCGFTFFLFAFAFNCFAQDGWLELALDLGAKTVTLPKIFRTNMDLSGRGVSQKMGRPKNLASTEALDAWQKDIGFKGVYRLQYNLWEINAAAEDKAAYDELIANYENVIKRVNDDGGIVILDIFGTPAGLGRVLDNRAAPTDFKVIKGLIKKIMRFLSCEKKYNVWYEVW